MNYNLSLYISTFVPSNPDDIESFRQMFRDFAKLYDLHGYEITVTNPDIPEEIIPVHPLSARTIVHFEYKELNTPAARRVILEDVTEAFSAYYGLDCEFEASESNN